MLLDALTGWTLFTGLTLAIGVLAGRWLIVPRAFAARVPEHADAGGGPPDVLGRDAACGAPLAAVGVAGALLVCVGVALYLVRQILEFRDPFAPLAEDVALLMGTSWGTTWKATAVGAVALVVAFGLARAGRRSGWWVATPLALALGSFPGLTGHASGMEGVRTLALIADATHVWAAGAWIGGLAAVLWLELRARSAEGGSATLLPVLVPSFSRVAVVAVPLLVVTGGFAGFLHLESPAALVTTAYGRLLLLKLGLVAVVLALGARNFRVLTPRLGTQEGDDALRRSAATELLVAQLVLLVTALLVRTSPLGH